MAEDQLHTSFVMHGARVAMLGGMPHIEEQIAGIEKAIGENPGLTFDLAKTLIEGACKTILLEREVVFSRDDDLPKLFKAVTSNLPLLPPTASNEIEARRSLDRTLTGLHTALQGICELRNHCGFASHGSGSPRPIMENVQAILAAQTADAIVGFLHRVHKQDRASLPLARIEYGDNTDFNEFIDEANELVKVFELEYMPSEVLFSVDNQAYRDRLVEFVPEDMDLAEGPQKEEE